MTENTNSGRTRVLLVEDSEINRELLQKRLRRRGFEVEVAADGLAGYRQALASAPDVVLMDMSLPEMDGWEATSRLREESFSSPIIGLTAHALAEDRKRALAAGCNAFITKPVDFDLLVDSIHRLANAPTNDQNAAPAEPVPNPGLVSQSPIDIAVAATLAEHAHALNNARAALIAAIEVGDTPELAEAMMQDADAAVARLAIAWSAQAEALYRAQTKVHSAKTVISAVARELNTVPGACVECEVRVDLVALAVAASILCSDLARDARVDASLRTDGPFTSCAFSIGPVASLPDTADTAALSLIRQLHTTVEVDSTARVVTLLFPTTRPKVIQ